MPEGRDLRTVQVEDVLEQRVEAGELLLFILRETTTEAELLAVQESLAVWAKQWPGHCLIIHSGRVDEVKLGADTLWRRPPLDAAAGG